MDVTTLFARLKAHGGLPENIAAVDAIWSERVDQFLKSHSGAKVDGKSVKDAVWGMIELSPKEVLLVDSPPMQRLRRIRQLGLGYLTYPTAGYSRFEHTLGAVHQAERMLRAIALRSEEYESQILDALEVVRLAALIHDIGHLPLSHVSERFYSLSESSERAIQAEALRTDFADALGSSKPELAECLSVVLISSESMGRILSSAGYSDEAVAKAALAISGRVWSARQFFVRQLISNVIDADKLDYMFRDGFVTRVPLAVDLERLLYKLRVVPTSARNLPAGRRGHIPHDAEALVLGTDVAGDRLSYEVSQARSMLFERVYFHHKTRAAERVALCALAELDLPPVELLRYDDELFGAFGVAEFGGNLTDVVGRLQDRRLPRRVFAVTPAFAEAQGLEQLWRIDQDDDLSDEYLEAMGEPDVRDAEGAEQIAKRGINWTLADPERRVLLEGKIEEWLRKLSETLQISVDLRLWMDTPPRPPAGSDTALFVVRVDGELGRDQGYPPTAAAATYEPLHIAYVFVDDPNEHRALIYIACEFAFQDLLDLIFDRSAADFAKVSWEDIQDTKRLLEEKDADLFAEHGRLRPQSMFAHSAEPADVIDDLAKRFHSFSTDADIHVNAARIRAFLDQFPENLVPPMLECLRRVEIFDRARFAGFGSYLAGIAPEGAIFVPLTTQRGKSADHLPYFFADQAPDLDIRSLVEALETEKPIVIYDDLILSGTQSEKVVRTWFGQRRHRSSKRLNARRKAALKEHLHAFAFGWGWEPGMEELDRALKGLDLKAPIETMNAETPTPRLDGLPREAELRDFLAQVGRDLLQSTRGRQPAQPWGVEKCEENALGFGNSERLIVTEYNVPAGTVTALWKQGGYRGAKWLPLFPRRRG